MEFRQRNDQIYVFWSPKNLIFSTDRRPQTGIDQQLFAKQAVMAPDDSDT